MGNLHGEFAGPGPVRRGPTVTFGTSEHARALPTLTKPPGRPAEVARGVLAMVVAPVRFLAA